MKNKVGYQLILLLILSLISLKQLYAQVTTISRDWKFKTGDSLQWASPCYDDTKWNGIKAGLWWAHAGYEYSGFAWYRKNVFISSQLKQEVVKAGYLKLSLGQIQDVDQTFLNGKLIGQTGSIFPFDGKWGQPRNYLIKADQIKWDEENTISVRVYGPNNNGGMHTGPYTYEPYRLTFKDFVKVVDSHIIPIKIKKKDAFRFSVVFLNSGVKSYTGELLFQLRDSANAIVETQKKQVKIQTNNDSLSVISFDFCKPYSELYKISATFTEARTAGQLTKEVTISTLSHVYLPLLPQPKTIVENKIPDAYIPAPFENQQIGGLLGERLDINLVKRLLQVNEKELLAGYQNRPGKQNWVGEHVGKYLEAACNTWRYCSDPRLKAQMDRMLSILLYTQKEDGYLGTYTPDEYWTNWDVWSHKYNMIGLIAYYKTTGYRPALDAAKRIGDLLCKMFGNNIGQIDIVTSGTHVGMASTSVLDPLVDLYRYTGDQKYLDFAKHIISSYNNPDGPEIIKSLLERGCVNKVANGKAYELLSNLVGITKLYKLTGDEELLKAVAIAWKDIVKNRLYVTGAASSYELFRDDYILPAGSDDHMGEGCVTTSWFQLNYQLFTLTGQTMYYNEIEKTVYNHLVGAENPVSGCVSYYTPLQNKKPYSCDITCCLSSIPRGISMIPLINYGKILGVPTLLLPESGRITDSVLTQEQENIFLEIEAQSSFPDSGNIVYTLIPEHSAVFPMSLRVPAWANEFTAAIGNEIYTGVADNFLTINRKWNAGDMLKVTFGISATVLSGGKSYPGTIAFKRGPQILGIDQSLNSLYPVWPIEIRNFDENCFHLNAAPENLIPGWVGKQAYSLITTDEKNNQKKIVLVPFCDTSQTGGNTEVWIKKIKSE